ncbi:hypothetical protein ONS96_012769 [Cadophora gregata f. sp. sojae]|nr:hypothetical protein ONS96_012769 [Cadophora gregata f. sp. sojae]
MSLFNSVSKSNSFGSCNREFFHTSMLLPNAREAVSEFHHLKHIVFIEEGEFFDPEWKLIEDNAIADSSNI